MAENKSVLPMDQAMEQANSPQALLDLAKFAKNKRTSRSSRTPMSVLDQIPPSKLPISPPPEETLRRVSKPTPFTPSLLANSGSAPVSAPKRKRTTLASAQPPASPGPAEVTPNPKPRKQTKHHFRQNSIPSPTRSSSTAPQELTPTKAKRVVIKSPHVANPNADYMPPISNEAEASTSRRTFSAKARRSATPIPPYEPPSVVYTPPREVMMTPTISKSSKRKTRRHTNTKHLKLSLPVKKELPDIDLSAPMPPPSPTDDPLLLSGSVPPLSTPPKPKVYSDAVVETQSLPPSSPLADEHFDDLPIAQPTWAPQYSDSSDFGYMDMDENLHLATFDLNVPVSDGAWTESDDDGAEPDVIDGVGEITGRWRMVKVPTKQDPPSSATRARMEKWGRPISPFPGRVQKALGSTEDDDETTAPIEKLDFSQANRNAAEPSPSVAPLNSVRSQVPRMGMDTFNLEAAIQQDAPAPQVEGSSHVSEDSDMSLPDPGIMYSDGREEEEEEEVRLLSVEPEDRETGAQSPVKNNQQDTDFTAGSTNRYTFSQVSPMQQDNASAETSNTSQLLPTRAIPFPRREPFGPESEDTAVNTSFDDEDGAEEEGYGTGFGMVKITSSDPRAAARAAAILKQHDYDCFTKILQQKKRRTSHSTVDSMARDNWRKSLAGSGIRKAQSAKKERRTLGGVVGDQVFLPGTPTMTLPELLAAAEKDLNIHQEQESLHPSPQRDPFKTPLPRRQSTIIEQHRPVPSQFTPLSKTGERTWVKDDWKQLDGCFTDERLAVAMDCGVASDELADVDNIHIENVVERFIALYGGYATINQYGDGWKRHNILQRVLALRHKQKVGLVAPPTTPLVTPRASSNAPLHMLAVPDFTPLSRRPPLRNRPVLPPPVSDGPFKDLGKVPPTLLAPRYSHLLEEAVAVSENQYLLTPGTGVGIPEQSSQPPSPPPQTRPLEPPSTTLGKRVKGFLFSYLPTIPKTAPPSTKIKPTSHPGLPLPPLDVLSRSRPPVVTPARPPIQKPKAPKELVHLQPAPQPVPSRIPRPVQPRRLVDLHPVPKPAESAVPISVPRPRRSSGGSVKDLIQNYEQLESGSVRSQSRLSQHSEAGSSGALKKAPNFKTKSWRP